jgi:hypothetical protein
LGRQDESHAGDPRKEKKNQSTKTPKDKEPGKKLKKQQRQVV